MERFLVADFPQGLTAPKEWFKSRNNIAITSPLRPVKNIPINDFFGSKVVSDFDLLAGPVDRPATGGLSNVYAEPIYRNGHGAGASGLYQLAEHSPGRKTGEPSQISLSRFSKARLIWVQAIGARTPCSLAPSGSFRHEII